MSNDREKSSSQNRFEKISSESRIQLISTENLLNVYIVPLYETLTHNLFSQVKNRLSVEQSFRYYFIIAFLVSLCLFYLFIWLPFLYSLNEELKKIREMLEILPLSFLISLEQSKDKLKNKEKE